MNKAFEHMCCQEWELFQIGQNKFVQLNINLCVSLINFGYFLKINNDNDSNSHP